jgi:DNA-binding MarR family transcriptional regulator
MARYETTSSIVFDGNSTQIVYAFIVEYWRRNAFSPSVREIAEGCYMGVATVMRHLNRLEARGDITREMRRARSIHLCRG